MIASVIYTSPAPSQAVSITMQDGAVWSTDAGLPADTEIRRALAAWLAAGGVIAPYVAPPAPVPASITRRQCARELFKREMISGSEMVAMTATGTPPAMIEVIFAAIDDEDEESEARADFAADTYQRSNPLLTGVMTDAITAQTPGATEAMINAAIDDFFRAAGAR